jgi:uncharacterized protein
MESLRTCLGCRQRAPRNSLLRIVARDGAARVDSAARLPGRGAWVHPTPGCVDAAVRRTALGRALRTAITDTSDLHEWTDRHMDK